MAIDREVRAAKEAKEWWDRLGRRHITNAEVRAWAAWRDDPVNDAAYTELERKEPRSRGRYVVLPSARGFSVIDTFTGEPAKFAEAQQTDISVEDANDIADILNARGVQRAGWT